MGNEPKVTVLLPFRDTRADWFSIALACMARQTYKNLQVIACDDGSTKSSTIEAAKAAQEKWPDRLRIVRRGVGEIHGTAYALDEALRHADSDTRYLSKFDADDIASPSREARRVQTFERLPEVVGIVYEPFLQLNYLPRPYLQPIVVGPYDMRANLDESLISGNAMWRASVYDKVPRTFVYPEYDGKCNKHAEDYAFWLRVTDYYDAFYIDCDPAETWVYRNTGQGKYWSDRKGVDYAKALLQHQARMRRGLARDYDD